MKSSRRSAREGMGEVYRARDTRLGRDVAIKVIGKYADDSAYQIAEVYAARGEGSNAFQWLDRAYSQHDGGLATELQGSVHFRGLHDDPRWGRFLKKLGFDR